jgi:protein gp37
VSTNSAIEWTDVTWNPTTGCDRISPGCDNCYALTLAKRLKAMGSPKYQQDGHPRTSGPGFGVATHQDALLDPMVRWPKRGRRMVFVNSMSDLFHVRVPTEFVARVFATMAITAQHTYQILTKRPRRMRELLDGRRLRDATLDALLELRRSARVVWSAEQARLLDWPSARMPWPLPNVWLGTSIESDEYVWRADELRRVPAAVRFLSCEPLLGPLPNLDLDGIDWVIVGGESGPKFRALDLDWVRDLRGRCLERPPTRLFFKQVGGLSPKTGGRLLDGRTWDEFPVVSEPAARGA